jgi:hypothetical protein
MSGKCRISDCAAPGVPCHLGCEDYKTCENFIAENSEKKIKKEKNNENKKSNLSWTGEAFTPDEIHQVSSRSTPILIGIVGKADAGKTTFLAMVYTLLLNGKKLKNYSFAGTKTILGWDELHNRLRLKKGEIPFPAPTPVSSNRLYHFALRNEDQHLKDVLFSDASGEVFSNWATNRDDENAESARWIYANSNAFMLFIDCEMLAEQKNFAKREIMLIARQLTHDLKGRLVIAVWSKSDKKGEVLPAMKDALKTELSNLFPRYFEVEISNFLEPGPDELVHKNNLIAIDLLLENIELDTNVDLTLTEISSDDLLINYKGR